jgi:hypothetical protein
MLFWGYFEGAHPGPVPTFLSHRFGERFILAIPADSGLYQVLIWPERSELQNFRADLPAAFLEHASACQPVAEALDGAKQVGKIQGAVHWDGYFRAACGPGWVLTGDAGHFKSPAPGRGIGDAFLQAETLATAITSATNKPNEKLDRAMRSWGRWRDREFAEHYWIANDFEDPGHVPSVLVEVLRRLQQQGKAELFFEVLNHRIRPSRVLTPPRVLRAVAHLLATGTSTAERCSRKSHSSEHATSEDAGTTGAQSSSTTPPVRMANIVALTRTCARRWAEPGRDGRRP